MWYGKISFKKNVYFDSSCKYEIEGEDMMDTNKLFGVGYFFNHHVDSARLGWRYDPYTQKIVLSAYCYVNGKRVISELCKLRFFTWYAMEITVLNDCYIFDVKDTYNPWTTSLATFTVMKTHRKKFQFRLGIFFGGNKKAPHTMKIEMK